MPSGSGRRSRSVPKDILGRERDHSPAATLGYSARTVAVTEKEETLGVAGIGAGRDVVVELLSVAKSNPIIGVVLGIMIVDIAHKAKAITDGAYGFANSCLAVAFGL